ncbi:hypothetical protein CCO03_06175 [Comamonas serinivorans]|uniref:Uncharacterized protein n=1 Tax=Comamonas serinivorans TaxID=1082851 RepID=A0A1Y0EL07_9BURK|nr:YceH family protein [Comamonas serinivorans]ARU04315.1 hypothetical protein CCO03_06175 [Comamonas serinivorans]
MDITPTAPTPFDPQQTPLSPVEARVLGTLMEKARTVPDTYPMTLNGLVTGCNQKTSRDPVLQLSEAEVLAALDELRQRHLVHEVSGGRTPKYSHQFTRVLAVPDQSAALLGLLMLRGPQTAGELRLNAERWHRFADISSVEAFLDELANRSAEKGGPLVTRLARTVGERESRWTQLLTGGSHHNAQAGQSPAPATPDSDTAADISALKSRVSELETQLQALCEALGLSQKRPSLSQNCDKSDPLTGD